MREALTSGKFLKLAGMMLAAAALLLTSLAAATAQERPRTLFDLLFGSRQAQPQRQYERPAPQRVKPKPKRPRASSPAAHAAAPSAAAPAVEIATKKPDAKKILVVGDFIGNGLAEGLDAAFATDPDLTVATRVNGSSGFVRDDYFNWPDNIGKILDEEKPAAVVVMIGANDRQAITANGNSLQPRSPEWNAEYQKRVAAFTKVISDRHYPLVWVGQPPFRPKGMSQDMLALNEIYRNAAEKAGGKFADVWDGFVDEEGNFTQTGFDINGQTARLRANDGINITSTGKRKLAFYAEKPLHAYLGVSREEGNSLPATHSLDPSKPVDRVAPISLRDINKDDSGILLGGTPAMQAKPLKTEQKKANPSPGRADDFSWPRNGKAPRK
ncbi:SGNH/GDSL hydrolase family protein [Brucella abortus]|uniref:SGNH/GDSL hydrolase family protein n=1 Tax=Brucella abortus TaxID=235 RepID=UPI0031FD9A1F